MSDTIIPWLALVSSDYRDPFRGDSERYTVNGIRIYPRRYQGDLSFTIYGGDEFGGTKMLRVGVTLEQLRTLLPDIIRGTFK